MTLLAKRSEMGEEGEVSSIYSEMELEQPQVGNQVGTRFSAAYARKVDREEISFHIAIITRSRVNLKEAKSPSLSKGGDYSSWLSAHWLWIGFGRCHHICSFVSWSLRWSIIMFLRMFSQYVFCGEKRNKLH